MALEIKGLKGKASKAGTMFDRLNRAYDKLIETGETHATDVESLPAQIDGMQDDLTFMVQTLGNSVNGSGESEKPKEKPKEKAGEKQVITPADVGEIDQGLVSGLPEVETPATFPEA